MDSETQAGMSRLISRFPERKTQIEERVREEEDLCEICQDLQAVARAMEHWQQQPAPNADRYVQEYGTLAQELENEALYYLQ